MNGKETGSTGDGRDAVDTEYPGDPANTWDAGDVSETGNDRDAGDTRYAGSTGDPGSIGVGKVFEDTGDYGYDGNNTQQSVKSTLRGFTEHYAGVYCRCLCSVS